MRSWKCLQPKAYQCWDGKILPSFSNKCKTLPSVLLLSLCSMVILFLSLCLRNKIGAVWLLSRNSVFVISTEFSPPKTFFWIVRGYNFINISHIHRVNVQPRHSMISHFLSIILYGLPFQLSLFSKSSVSLGVGFFYLRLSASNRTNQRLKNKNYRWWRHRY